MFKATALHRTTHSGHEVYLQDDFIRLDIKQRHLSLMETTHNRIPTTIIKLIIGHPKGNLDPRLSHYLNNVDRNIEADPLAPILSERMKLRYAIRKEGSPNNSRNRDSQA